MSVLQYGFPNREGIRCDHPICVEYATHRIWTQFADKTEREQFACNEHAAGMQIGQPKGSSRRVETLKVAGERNRPKGQPEPEAKPEVKPDA